MLGIVRRRFTLGGAIAAALLGLVVAFALRSLTGADQSSPLQVPQSARATASGVAVSTLAATFAAGNTLLQVRVDVGELESARSIQVARVSAQAADFAPGSLRPFASAGDEAILRFSNSSPVILRLPEVSATGANTVSIARLTVQTQTGESFSLVGPWELEIKTPPDIAARLRSEPLAGGAEITDRGISVQVVGGLRTAAETLITVELTEGDQPAKVDLLDQPRLVASGKTLTGGVAQQRENGSLITFTFPPTAFGEPVKLEFGPLSRRGVGNLATYSEVDLGALRPQLKLNEDVPVPVVSTGGNLESPVLSAALSQTNLASGVVATVRITLEGNFQSSATEIRALLPGGETIRAGELISSYRKSPDGAIGSGTTQVSFERGELSRWTSAPVRIYSGGADQIVRGNWSIEVRPATP